MTNKYFEKLISILRKRQQLVFYVISGVASLVADYSTFIILYYICNLSVEISAPIGLVVGFVVSFLMNRLWTFKHQASKGKRQSIKQLTLYLVLFIINNLFTVVFINYLASIGVLAAVSKIFSTIIITLWNYVLYKKVIFK